MNNSMRDALIFFLFLFFIFAVFGGTSKAESYKVYDTESLSNMIWQVCKDQADDEDAFFQCSDYYNNCVINKGPIYKDGTFLECIKTKVNSN